MADPAGQEDKRGEGGGPNLSGLLKTIEIRAGNIQRDDGMISQNVVRKGLGSMSGYCCIPKCGGKSTSLTIATQVALTFYGFKDGLAVVKICPKCADKAEEFKALSMERIRQGESIFGVDREPIGVLPEMVDLEPTNETPERPVAPSRKEIVEVEFDRTKADTIVKDILKKYRVHSVQLRKCKQQFVEEVNTLGEHMDDLEKTMKEVDDKLYDTYKRYNRHVDTRPKPIVIQEWEINADSTVRRRNLGGDDAVFVNSDSLNRLSSLIEKSSTAGTSGAEDPSSTTGEAGLNDSIVSLPEATPRKSGPASRTGYYEALDAQRTGPFERKAARPVELKVKTQGSLLSTPNVIPRVKPKVGDIVFAMNKNLLSFWLQGEILEIVHNDATNLTEFVVHYEPTRNGNPTGGREGDGTVRMIRQLCLKQMAYNLPCPFTLPVGTRVIAKFVEDGRKDSDVDGLYYAGIIAEPPKKMSQNRYLVFFDDGYAQYVFPDDVLLVCESSNCVWNDVYPDSYDFIKAYITKWPNWPMVKLSVGHRVATEWNGRWMSSVVLEVDQTLARVKFDNDGREEWIYRGSTRFRPIHKVQEVEASRSLDVAHKENKIPRHDRNVDGTAIEYKSQDPTADFLKVALKSTSGRRNYFKELELFSGNTLTTNHINMLDPDLCVEFQGSLSKLKIPEDSKPKEYLPHQCNPSCSRPYERTKEMKRLSPLAIPFFFGWGREVVKSPRLQIFYRSPCGFRLRDIEELAKYLTIINSNFSIDHFCFEYAIDCLHEFVPARALVNIKDISYGKESVFVQCINSVDYDNLPFMEYIPNRILGKGVNINTDDNFLACCDCTDNCEDKDKCACWKLTREGYSFTKMNDPNNPFVGYEHRRLKDHIVSGIYECNSNCKCKSTCSNRVVQNGVQWPLQIFKTTKKGWGIRAVYDMPEGTFLCIYAGQVLNDQTANEDGMEFGDEYLAELDYIECIEGVKENYESDVTDIEDEDNSEEEEAKRLIEDSSESEEEVTKANASQGDGGLNKRKFATRRTTGQKRNLEANAEIVNNDDDIITARDARFSPRVNSKRKRGRERKSTRAMYGDDEKVYIMDAKSKGNIGRYLNHSCCPNVFVQNVFVDTHDLRFPLVAFFTNTYVRAGTELTWDYHYSIGSVPDKVLYCYCMTPYCRGRLL